MDVGVNKPFRDGIQFAYDNLCVESDFNRKPQREDVAVWIKEAYDGVKEQQIIKTWRRIGIRGDDDINSNNEAMPSADIEDGINYLDINLEDNVEEITPEEIEGELLYCNDNDNNEAVYDNVNVDENKDEEFKDKDDPYNHYNNANSV
jgi:hypothetical protein